jgi:hypothetical protein
VTAPSGLKGAQPWYLVFSGDAYLYHTSRFHRLIYSVQSGCGVCRSLKMFQNEFSTGLLPSKEKCTPYGYLLISEDESQPIGHQPVFHKIYGLSS